MFVFLPCRKDTSIWGEGTAETICERSDGLRGPLLNAPETDQPENRHRADQLRTLKRGENESVSVQFTESQIVFLKLDVCDCLSYPSLKKKHLWWLRQLFGKKKPSNVIHSNYCCITLKKTLVSTNLQQQFSVWSANVINSYTVTNMWPIHTLLTHSLKSLKRLMTHSRTKRSNNSTQRKLKSQLEQLPGNLTWRTLSTEYIG